VKKILGVIYDMTKAKIAKYIGEAKAYYRGLRFIGLSADCWTSLLCAKRGRGRRFPWLPH
jgi:hypothetical protein